MKLTEADLRALRHVAAAMAYDTERYARLELYGFNPGAFSGCAVLDKRRAHKLAEAGYLERVVHCRGQEWRGKYAITEAGRRAVAEGSTEEREGER